MISAYLLLAGIVQLVALAVMVAAAHGHSKYCFAVALGASVTVLSFSLAAVRGEVMVSVAFLAGFALAGGILAIATLVVIAAVQRHKSRSRQATQVRNVSKKVA